MWFRTERQPYDYRIAAEFVYNDFGYNDAFSSSPT